jgi:hypothetical protein
MRKLLALPLIAMLGLGACTDPYGRVDPLATGLLGAGLGAAAGVGIASASRPSYGGGYYAQGPTYYAPPPRYYAPPPRYFAPPPAYYRPGPVYYGRPGWGPGWGHGRRW